MGRLRPFVWGVASGGAAYAVSYLYSTSKLEALESGLKALRHEINPDAPAPSAAATSSGSLGSTQLDTYRAQAAESFRKNWNGAVQWGYSKFLTSLRNPYLHPSDATPQEQAK